MASGMGSNPRPGLSGKMIQSFSSSGRPEKIARQAEAAAVWNSTVVPAATPACKCIMCQK